VSDLGAVNPGKLPPVVDQPPLKTLP